MSVPTDLRWWHESLIDWMFLNPDKSLVDAAGHFNCSHNYICLLTASDSFKRRFAERREQLTGEIRRSTIERLRGLADTTIDCLTERIARERNTIALVDVRETMDSALKAIGYGTAPQEREPRVQNNVYVVTQDDLARARELMVRRQATIDVPLHTSAEVIPLPSLQEETNDFERQRAVASTGL